MIQGVLLDQLFAEMSTATLCEDRVFGMKFHSGFVGCFGFSIFAPAHLSCGHTLNRALVIKEHFTCRKPRVNLHAQRFGLFSQPANHLTKADNVIAVVMHGPRSQRVGDLDGFVGSGEKVDFIAVNRRIERSPALCPIGEEFIECGGLDHSPGKNMVPDRRSFLEDDHAQFVLFFVGQLHQSAGRCQSGRPAPDNHHIHFHGFAFDHFLCFAHNFLGKWFTKDSPDGVDGASLSRRRPTQSLCKSTDEG